MKWTKFRKKQKEDKTDWHLWFAIKPVVVHRYSDGSVDKVWMETVLRRYVLDQGKIGIGIPSFWKWEYKLLPEQPNVPDKPTTFPLPVPPRPIDTETTTLCISGENPWEKPEPEVEWETLVFGTPTEEEREGKGSDITSLTDIVCINCKETFPPEDIHEDGGCIACHVLVDKEPLGELGQMVVDGYNARMQEPDQRTEPCNISKGLWDKEQEDRHDIDSAWEAKRARRNKTIM